MNYIERLLAGSVDMQRSL